MLQLATFPEAPLRSRTVGFPESGSDLGFSPGGLPGTAEAQALARVHPLPVRLTSRLVLVPRVRHLPGSAPGCHPDPGPPSAQSPFAWRDRYSPQGGVLRHLDGRYPIFLAPTGSCARPPPSRRLQALTSVGGSTQVAASPCWVMALPDVISASLSQDAWACVPAGRGVHVPVPSPTSSAFPKSCRWVGFPHESAKRLHRGQVFRDRRHSLLQASWFARHPGLSYRCDPKAAGQP